ncbi:hypothetical protein NDU88_004928 [Pleurodeles waltl]|uniref:Uncharacterized protein n=1 Tax=Pleurodeles waltl TaxID=8319 RepID=A0AAV7UGR4_PLEWA|nr:hypothetical protein NDU88_004928 [Pleurodeles waltl]
MRNWARQDGAPGGRTKKLRADISTQEEISWKKEGRTAHTGKKRTSELTPNEFLGTPRPRKRRGKPPPMPRKTRIQPTSGPHE